jgi:hypothetical protein
MGKVGNMSENKLKLKWIEKFNKLFDWNYRKIDITEKFPSKFNEDDGKALQSDWEKVGADLKVAMNEYGNKIK